MLSPRAFSAFIGLSSQPQRMGIAVRAALIQRTAEAGLSRKAVRAKRKRNSASGDCASEKGHCAAVFAQQ
jgi:hypothetical protein